MNFINSIITDITSFFIQDSEQLFYKEKDNQYMMLNKICSSDKLNVEHLKEINMKKYFSYFPSTPFEFLCRNKNINLEILKYIIRYNPKIQSFFPPLKFLFKNPSFKPEMMNLFINLDVSETDYIFFPEEYYNIVKTYKKIIYILFSKILILELKIIITKIIKKIIS